MHLNLKNRNILLILFVFTILLLSCSYPAAFPSLDERYLNEKQVQLKNYAREFIGVPYRYGGVTREGMDCSGLVVRVYKDVYGFTLPHSTALLYKRGKWVSVRALRTGDLVFFRTENRSKPSHVGIYLDTGSFIHASSSRGVIVSKLTESYYKKRLMGIKRVI